MHGAHVLCLQGFRSQFSESTLNTVRNSPGPSSLYFGLSEMLITAVIRVWCHRTRLSGQGRIFSLFYKTSRWAHKVLNQPLLFFCYILRSSWQRLNEEPASLKSCSFLLFSFRMQDSMNRRDWRHLCTVSPGHMTCLVWDAQLHHFKSIISHTHLPVRLTPSQHKCFPPITTGRTQPKLPTAFNHPQILYFPADLSVQPCP